MESCINCTFSPNFNWDRRDRMVVGFTTAYGEIYLIQHYVSLSMTCDKSVFFSGVIRFPPPVKLATMI